MAKTKENGGQPSEDPSENVFRLVAANERRQDDLRESESRHIREKVADAQAHQREISRCIEEMAALRADYEDKLRIKEGSRIDAVRSVDVQASQQQAADAEIRAATLAKTGTDSAEALRNQVIQSQIAATDYVNSSLEPLKKDVSELRQKQYEQQGKGLGLIEGKDTAADFAAALAPMFAEIKKLSDAAQQNTGGAAAVDIAKLDRRANLAIVFGSLGGFVGVVGLIFGAVKIATG